MIELVYDYDLNLYKLVGGKRILIKKFTDKRDLLDYIEDEFEYAILYMGSSL